MTRLAEKVGYRARGGKESSWCNEKGSASYCLARVAMAKDHRPRARAAEVHCLTPGGRKPETMALAGGISSDVSLLGLSMAVFSLCPHVVFPLCVPVF